VRSTGKPVGPNDLGFLWEPVDPPNGACGVGDMGYGPGWGAGGAELPCQEGTWRISVMEGGEEFGAGTVAVLGGKTVDLTIRLRVDPPPATTPHE